MSCFSRKRVVSNFRVLCPALIRVVHTFVSFIIELTPYVKVRESNGSDIFTFVQHDNCQ